MARARGGDAGVALLDGDDGIFEDDDEGVLALAAVIDCVKIVGVLARQEPVEGGADGVEVSFGADHPAVQDLLGRHEGDRAADIFLPRDAADAGPGHVLHEVKADLYFGVPGGIMKPASGMDGRGCREMGPRRAAHGLGRAQQYSVASLGHAGASAVKFHCPNPECRQKIKVRDSLAGRKLKCPQCGLKFRVPDQSTTRTTGSVALELDEGGRQVPTREVKEWEPGEVIEDLYVAQRKLGEGGMGTVWLVRHRNWGIDLAVKSPSTRGLQMAGGEEELTREAETWVNLQLHPNIVQAFYVRNIDGIPRIFIQYCEGGSLEDWQSQGGRRPPAEVLDMAIQVCWGMAHAHKQGLIHRDLKPKNVLVAEDGTAKVTDFGLAKMGAASGENSGVQGGPMVEISTGYGTPGYASPEQSRAGAKIDHRADLFAFGVTLWVLLGGEITWAGRSVVAKHSVASQLKRGGAQTETSDLHELVLRCLDPEPGQRHPDFAAVSEELRAIYGKVCGKAYGRPAPVAADLLADGLNNRAISLMDLGKTNEAHKLWDEALRMDPHHVEATHNRGLTLWRAGLMSYENLVTQMREAAKSAEKRWSVDYLLGTVHTEFGDAGSAYEVLERAHQAMPNRAEILEAWQSAEEGLGKWQQCARVFKGYTAGLEAGDPHQSITGMDATPDGRWAVCRREDGRLRLWDLQKDECVKTLSADAGQTEPTGNDQEHGTGWLGSVCIGSDGRLALSAGPDHLVRAWSVPSGECEMTLEGHRGAAHCVSMGPDARWALSADRSDRGGALIIWDVREGRRVEVLKGHQAPVRCVSVGPDGWAITGHTDGACAVWRIPGGEKVAMFDTGDPALTCVGIAPDGRLALSGGNVLKLWQVGQPKCLKVLGGHTSRVNCLGISPDGRRALTGSDDCTVRLWKMTSGQCLGRFQGHKDGVLVTRFRPDGRQALSGSLDRAVRLWDIEAAGAAAPFALAVLSTAGKLSEQRDVCRAAVGKAEDALAASRPADAAAEIDKVLQLPGYERNTELLTLWRTAGLEGRRMGFRDGWLAQPLAGHTADVTCLDVSADGYWAISGGSDNSLMLWSIPEQRGIWNLPGKSNDAGLASVQFTRGGLNALAASKDGWLRLWAMSNAAAVKAIGTKCSFNPIVQDVSVTHDGRWALVIRDSSALELWDAESGRREKTMGSYDGSLSCVAVAPSGLWAVAGVKEEQDNLHVWDLVAGELVGSFSCVGGVDHLAIGSDGSRVLAACDETLSLCDFERGRRVRTFGGGRGHVNCLSIFSDGNYAVTAAGNVVFLWDLETGQCLRTFEGHERPVACLAVSPDARWLLSGAFDGELKLWELIWDYEFPGAADLDLGIRHHLRIFLARHRPYAKVGLRRRETPGREGRASWGDRDLKRLLTELQQRGYGWLRPEGVRRELERLAGSAPR